MDNRVGFGPRLGAAAIDAGVMAILGFVFGGVVGTVLALVTGSSSGPAEADPGGAGMAAAAGALGGLTLGLSLVGALYSLIEGLTGASPGKMILKLKIGTADGRPAAVPVYLTRWAIKFSYALLGTIELITGLSVIKTLGSAAGLVVFVGCFLVLGASKQAVHDLVARTAVYNAEDLARPGPRDPGRPER